MPPNYSDCLPIPDIETRRYMFPYKGNMHVTDTDSMSCKTENEYVIIKYNCKAIEDMCEDHEEREPTFNRHLHEWNWYYWNSNLK